MQNRPSSNLLRNSGVNMINDSMNIDSMRSVGNDALFPNNRESIGTFVTDYEGGPYGGHGTNRGSFNNQRQSYVSQQMGQTNRINNEISNFSYNNENEAGDYYEILNKIENIRSKAEKYANQNPGILRGLGGALNEINNNYFENHVHSQSQHIEPFSSNQNLNIPNSPPLSMHNPSGFHRESIIQESRGRRNENDMAKSSRESEFYETRSKPLRNNSMISKESDDEPIDEQEQAIINLINIEKTLNLMDNLNAVKNDKRRLEGIIVDQSNTVARQNDSIKGYQELLYQKSLLKREIANERASLMRDREFANEEFME